MQEYNQLKKVLRRLLPMSGMLAVVVALVYTNPLSAIVASRFWINMIEQSGPLV
ncbi:hypothetical protein [Lentzea albidocapillata]|uniref:Uncharacterized protein n=1 Tax=Lentzea albidocapillata TaxID=40571 RepID=A0A1W2BDX0_9PSEU|nr:hypothetical protein [Lentzea albidocapillata]SMC71109.1 hypothetical protein SAMN05660733_01428 [Lentzea albidocapillata]